MKVKPPAKNWRPTNKRTNPPPGESLLYCLHLIIPIGSKTVKRDPNHHYMIKLVPRGLKVTSRVSILVLSIILYSLRGISYILFSE